ncbi:MAG TPA: glycosyltransferase N-terminal domain-containing protein [Candidatus Goldiibacteriota bacterium]|nr:glycosyltransferase N-terminal domain-containing protein [Candidatus Goldiibacteriota bacterium]HPN65043.1 glycosyltransferase N-terminal domain-containing protein [Candidatus Goldiibacteriota bacterium]HRQ44740.1 glycosyltransferase N-terminal domain-containing protein [Candidatus Goldiibacteriota bacterium]
MMFLYNLLLNLLFILLLPFLPFAFIFGKKLRRGIGERLGIIGKETLNKIKGRSIIWFHAASVGETQALLPVISEFNKINDSMDIIITTTSINGRNKMREVMKEKALYICLLPLDLNFIIRPFIAKIAPKMAVVVETELWPNLIDGLHARHVPMAMINGRISVKSFGLYMRFKKFFSSLIEKFAILMMQSEKMVVRLRMMGVKREKMIMIRNTKYSTNSANDSSGKIAIPKDVNRKIVVAGSIRKGEEYTVIKGFKKSLLGKACLIIAPRHLDRVEDTKKVLEAENMTYVLWTEVQNYKAVLFYDAIILNTIGELQYIYKSGDYAIIGGGFKPFGGHNPMEAALNSLPVIMGRNMFNFEDTSQRFVKAGGAFMIDDSPEQLAEKLKFLYDNPKEAAEMGKKGKEAIEAFKGTAATTALIINEVLLENMSSKAEN